VDSALKAAAPDLIALISDPDPALRVALAAALGKLVSLNAQVTPALVAQLDVEADDAALLALAPTSAFGNDVTTEWKEAAARWLASDVPIRKLAGAMSLAIALKDRAPAEVIPPLLAALGHPEGFSVAWEKSVWGRGGLVVDVANIVSKLGDDRVPAVVQALAQALALGPQSGPGVAEALLFMAFGEGGAPRKSSALDPVRRDALTTMVNTDFAWSSRVDEVLGYAKLPASRDALRVWLGLPSSLILDREVEYQGKRQLLLKVVKARFNKNADAASFFAELKGQLTPLETLEAISEVFDGLYDLRFAHNEKVNLAGAWAAQVEKVSALDRAGVLAWATRWLERQPTSRNENQQARVRRLALLTTLQPGPLDPKFDKWVPVTYRPEPIHSRIPADRLEPMVFDWLRETALALGEPDSGWGIGFSNPTEQAARYLGLCPSRRLAELTLGLGALSGIWGDMEEEARKHAGHAVVADALAALEKRTDGVESYPRMRAVFADWVEPVFPRPARKAATGSKAKSSARKRK
jgi:hypothetical protein